MVRYFEEFGKFTETHEWSRFIQHRKEYELVSSISCAYVLIKKYCAGVAAELVLCANGRFSCMVSWAFLRTVPTNYGQFFF